MEEIKELTDDQWIARFMGKPLFLERYDDARRSDHKISYDGYFHEWNNLMPVVEKIVKLGLYKMTSVQAVELRALRFGIPIEKVYEKTVEFIRWYNQKDKT